MLLVPLCIVLASACDEPPAPAVGDPPTVRNALQITSLAPLAPNARTHLLGDGVGNIYWVQESEQGDDVLFVMSEGQRPRATDLSAASILAKMGATAASATAPAASGNIQSIAVGSNNVIYFFFLGGQGRETLAALGRYAPRTAAIKILADTRALMSGTGMGGSLALARGTLVTTGSHIWLWIRHTDDFSLFRFDVRDVRQGIVDLTKPFTRVSGTDTNIKLSSDEMFLSAGDGNGLLLLDVSSAMLWQIDAVGRATPIRALVALPHQLTPPVLDKAGRILLFASDAPLISPRTEAQAEAPILEAHYPALLIIEKSQMEVIDRDQFTSPPELRAGGIQLQQLVRFRDAFLGYDTTSGQLLRLQIVQTKQ